MARARGSANTVAASSNDTPCFFLLEEALRGFQAKFTMFNVIPLIGQRKVHHAAPQGRRGPRRLRTVGATGFEPATTCTPRALGVNPRRVTVWQAQASSGNHEGLRSASSHRRAQRAPGTAPNGAPVARTFRGWLTAGKIAARLRLCRATVYKLCAEGRLEHVRVGLSIRISEDQVKAYLDSAGTEVLTRSRTRRRGRPPGDAGDLPR